MRWRVLRVTGSGVSSSARGSKIESRGFTGNYRGCGPWLSLADPQQEKAEHGRAQARGDSQEGAGAAAAGAREGPGVHHQEALLGEGAERRQAGPGGILDDRDDEARVERAEAHRQGEGHEAPARLGAEDGGPATLQHARGADG